MAGLYAWDGARKLIAKKEELFLRNKDISELSGIGQSRLSNITNQKVRPTAQELRTIASILDINMEEWAEESKWVKVCLEREGTANEEKSDM